MPTMMVMEEQSTLFILPNHLLLKTVILLITLLRRAELSIPKMELPALLEIVISIITPLPAMAEQFTFMGKAMQ